MWGSCIGYLLWNVYPTLYRLGVDPKLLARLYKNVR